MSRSPEVLQKSGILKIGCPALPPATSMYSMVSFLQVFTLLLSVPCVNGIATLLDTSYKIGNFTQTNPISVIGLFSASSPSLTAFDEIANLAHPLFTGIAFAVVVDETLQSAFIDTTTESTPMVPALVAQVYYTPTGADEVPLAPVKRMIRSKEVALDLDALKTNRKRMKVILDFVYAQTNRPVIPYPDTRSKDAEKRATFALQCVWPKIIVPYKTSLTTEVSDMLKELGTFYRGVLHVFTIDVNDEQGQAYVKDTLDIELSSGFKILFYDPIKQQWPKYYSVTNSLKFDAVKRWLGGNINDHPNVIHHQLKKRKKKKKKRKKKKTKVDL